MWVCCVKKQLKNLKIRRGKKVLFRNKLVDLQKRKKIRLTLYHLKSCIPIYYMIGVHDLDGNKSCTWLRSTDTVLFPIIMVISHATG